MKKKHARKKLVMKKMAVALLGAGLFQAAAARTNLLEVLLANGTITQEQYEELKSQQESEAKKEKKEQESPKSNVVVEQKGGGFQIRTADGAFSFQPKGRLEMDSAWYFSDKSKLGDDAELRRAFLAMSGRMYKYFDYIVEYDFAASSFQDTYVQFNYYDPLLITVGHFKEPFSLEQLTSDLHTTFMERSLADTLAMGRRVGVGVSAYNNIGTLSWGAFWGSPSDNNKKEDNWNEEKSGWRTAARATFAPIHEEGKVAHVGAAVDYWDPKTQEGVRYRSRPESHITDVYLADTSSIADVDNVVTGGVELLGIYGPASLQAEYMNASVNRSSGLNDLGLSGWYVLASYFLTGESRAYDAKKGVIDRVKPKHNFPGGPGAWEVALRYSQLDLQDKDVKGGKESNITAGLNWYLNPNLKVKGEYLHVSADPSTAAVSANPHKGEKDEPQAVQMRVQYDF